VKVDLTDFVLFRYRPSVITSSMELASMVTAMQSSL
jgi:hypothetical protein